MIATALIEPAVSEEDAATFEALRPRLFRVAYRILGGAAEAEEAVQDTWIRWHGADRRAVRNTTALLTPASARAAHPPPSRHPPPGGSGTTAPGRPAPNPSAPLGGCPSRSTRAAIQ